MDHVAVGERVRRAREKAGLTQVELSERSGVTQATISRIENGERGVSFENAVAIARVCGCSLDALAGNRASRAA